MKKQIKQKSKTMTDLWKQQLIKKTEKNKQNKNHTIF